MKHIKYSLSSSCNKFKINLFIFMWKAELDGTSTQFLVYTQFLDHNVHIAELFVP